MTTPNLFALMGRLEELLQNEKRYLALRKYGFYKSASEDERWCDREEVDKYADELIEEQGDIQDE